MTARRSDGSRPELVYLNGKLLAESTARRPGRDYHWTADEGGTVELEDDLEPSEGDVLVVLGAPVQGAPRTIFHWSGTRWVDPDRSPTEVLEELGGVSAVFVLDADPDELASLQPVTRVLVRAEEGLDADSLEAVEDDVVRELRAVFGVTYGVEVLVLPAGDAADFVEARWRLGE